MIIDASFCAKRRHFCWAVNFAKFLDRDCRRAQLRNPRLSLSRSLFVNLCLFLSHNVSQCLSSSLLLSLFLSLFLSLSSASFSTTTEHSVREKKLIRASDALKSEIPARLRFWKLHCQGDTKLSGRAISGRFRLFTLRLSCGILIKLSVYSNSHELKSQKRKR